jgi:glycosyltransferase involved in cell wall biosynthesis
MKLHRLFKVKKNLGLFVSEPVIKDEFIKLGISADRLIIRPERYVNSSDNNVQACNNDNLLHFVTIGSLRSDKRIEMIVDAMKELSFPFQYVIAGESRNNYEATITSAIEGCEFVKRLNYRISDSEFKSLIQNSDFLMLGDKDNYSCVTNGTLMEALLAGTPVIAPDYGLYKYYVTKYGVGLLYNPSEKDSLVHALKTANELKKSSFEVGLKKIKKDFMFENISKQFCEDIKAIV